MAKKERRQSRTHNKKIQKLQSKRENDYSDHTFGSQTGEMKCTQGITLLEGTELTEEEKSLA